MYFLQTHTKHKTNVLTSILLRRVALLSAIVLTAFKNSFLANGLVVLVAASLLASHNAFVCLEIVSAAAITCVCTCVCVGGGGGR